jgi:hypothetical protein
MGIEIPLKRIERLCINDKIEAIVSYTEAA